MLRSWNYLISAPAPLFSLFQLRLQLHFHILITEKNSSSSEFLGNLTYFCKKGQVKFKYNNFLNLILLHFLAHFRGFLPSGSWFAPSMRILIQEFSFNRGSGSTSPSATQFYGMPDAGHTGTVPLVCCEDWSQKLCLLRLAVLMQFFKIKMFVQSTTFFIPAAYFCDINW